MGQCISSDSIETLSTLTVVTHDAERVMSASGPTMSVIYLNRMSEAQGERIRDWIAIFIGGDCTAVRLTYRSSDGAQRTSGVRSPHIAVMPTDEVYALSCEPRSDVVIITLDRLWVERKAREALGGARALTGWYSAVDPFVREAGNALKRELAMRRVLCVAYLQSFAEVIAIHMLKRYGKVMIPPDAGLPRNEVARVQAFVREHLAEVVRVEDLAALVHRSPYHFARLFKRATGQPPHIYITSQRIERARELLTNNNLSLADVAAYVGYQTQSHFTEVFHKCTGATPGMFRLRCKNPPLVGSRASVR